MQDFEDLFGSMSFGSDSKSYRRVRLMRKKRVVADRPRLGAPVQPSGVAIISLFPSPARAAGHMFISTDRRFCRSLERMMLWGERIRSR